MASDAGTAFTVDISNCEREPIHILGSIQPFGFLLAVSADWLISRASENIVRFTGVAYTEMLGRPLSDFFRPQALHDIRNRLTILRGPDAVERLFALPLMADGARFDVALHFVGRQVVIEAEPAPAEAEQAEVAGLIRSMLSRLHSAGDTTNFFREGARQVRALTDFDRVMVYRFDLAGSGEVVAEAKGAGIESFLGLNYPASDIPAQARALYLRSVFRIIADVNAVASPIRPGLDSEGKPLDQSLSVLRAVSPIHIEYLRNMGVQASMSISIIVDGKLWGLFACHHYAPRLPNFTQRSAAELFGQMFSMMLESRERREAAEYEKNARLLADRLMASAAQDNSLLTNAEWIGEIISESIPADGFGVIVEGQMAFSGLTPSPEQFKALMPVLNRAAASQIFTTDHIASVLPEASAYANKAAGLLAIPISRSPRDYVVLFRSERMRSVRWAGSQDKDIEYGPDGPRLSPRKSFEEWSELVRGKAAPFSAMELSVAETLRTALLEVVLRLSESAVEERRRAQEKQELLIAELNHRVRNILALIRGLISQTRDSALTSELFVETLEDRVQALARAHDQITADRWSPARLIDLIETESGAYLGAKRDRVKLTGPNVLIDPAAFTTLALVIHELMTNAAKYGALSDHGSVTVDWRLDEDGSLLLTWREVGGPAVTAPTRRGFGSTIIERSIPYDLGGHAETHYRLSGLEAQFCIPSRHIARVLAPAPSLAPKPKPAPVAKGLLEGLRVLLVEDSMIVALDGEDALRALGARDVQTAASLLRAMQIIEQGDIDLAVLDFNLGAETSLPAAEAILSKGGRFLFATGYGDSLTLPDSMRDAGVVKKPYDVPSLAAAIGALLAGPAS